MSVPARPRLFRVGSMTLSMELMVIGIGVWMLTLLVFGPWRARLAIIGFVAGCWAWLLLMDRPKRIHPGQRIRVNRGLHQGALGTMIQTVYHGHRVRIVLDQSDVAHLIELMHSEFDKIIEESLTQVPSPACIVPRLSPR